MVDPTRRRLAEERLAAWLTMTNWSTLAFFYEQDGQLRISESPIVKDATPLTRDEFLDRLALIVDTEQ